MRRMLFRWLRSGDPQGTPVVYFHGWPGSGDEVAILGGCARRHGVALYGIDRPGYGGTPSVAIRSLEAMACWYRHAIDALGLRQVGLLANSGGTPFAIATAALLGRRASRLGIACGLPPADMRGEQRLLRRTDHWIVRAASHCPASARLLFDLMQRYYRSSPRPLVANALREELPDRDRQALNCDAHARRLETACRRAFQQHGFGPAQDLSLFGKALRVAPERITAGIHIVHGLEDSIIAPEAVMAFDEALRVEDWSIIPGEGHFSLLLNQQDLLLSGFSGRGRSCRVPAPVSIRSKPVLRSGHAVIRRGKRVTKD